jgi:hypothetical protein
MIFTGAIASRETHPDSLGFVSNRLFPHPTRPHAAPALVVLVVRQPYKELLLRYRLGPAHSENIHPVVSAFGRFDYGARLVKEPAPSVVGFDFDGPMAHGFWLAWHKAIRFLL